MKVYEKLGIDLTTVKGLAKVLSLSCGSLDEIPEECTGLPCCECIAERLFKDVPTKKVKRWETYNGNFVKALECFRNTIPSEARWSTSSIMDAFAKWLMEEIEVVQNESM